MREQALQAVLDKLWSSHIEFSDSNAHAPDAARERWQEYAEHIVMRLVEIRAREQYDDAKEAGRREERLACYDAAMARSHETPSHSDLARAASSSCAVVADDIAARGPMGPKAAR